MIARDAVWRRMVEAALAGGAQEICNNASKRINTSVSDPGSFAQIAKELATELVVAACAIADAQRELELSRQMGELMHYKDRGTRSDQLVFQGAWCAECGGRVNPAEYYTLTRDRSGYVCSICIKDDV